MNESSGASSQPNSIKTEINRVLSRANLKTNHTELNNAINELTIIIDELEEQEQLLEIFETVAMTSNNESIVELRNELFTTVKLIHGDKINGALKEMTTDNNAGSFSASTTIGLTSVSSHSHPFSITGSTTSTSLNGISITSPMKVDGKSMPNCEDVEDIINATLAKHSIWNKIKDVFSREKKQDV